MNNSSKKVITLFISLLIYCLSFLSFADELAGDKLEKYEKLPILIYSISVEDGDYEKKFEKLFEDMQVHFKSLSDMGYETISNIELSNYILGKSEIEGKKIVLIFEFEDPSNKVNELLLKYKFEQVDTGHIPIGNMFESRDGLKVIRMSNIHNSKEFNEEMLNFESNYKLANSVDTKTFLINTYINNVTSFANKESNIKNTILEKESLDNIFNFKRNIFTKLELHNNLILLYDSLGVTIDKNIIDDSLELIDPIKPVKLIELKKSLEMLYMTYPIDYDNSDQIMLMDKEELDFKFNINKILHECSKKYNLNGQLGISITDLTTSYNYNLNGDLTYYDEDTNSTDAYFMAASVIKLPLAIALIDMIENNEIKLEDYSYDSYLKKNLNWNKEIYNLIAHSKNNPFNSALRVIGRDRINEKFTELGMSNFKVWSEIEPASGASKERDLLLYGTNKGGRVNPLGMEKALSYIDKKNQDSELMKTLRRAMRDSSYTGHGTRIPKGLSKSEVVLHKTGTVRAEGIYGDSGIIYGKNPYTMTILIQNESSEYNFDQFSIEFTNKVNTYINAK